jgi:hypothetical protein
MGTGWDVLGMDWSRHQGGLVWASGCTGHGAGLVTGLSILLGRSCNVAGLGWAWGSAGLVIGMGWARHVLGLAGHGMSWAM